LRPWFFIVLIAFASACSSGDGSNTTPGADTATDDVSAGDGGGLEVTDDVTGPSDTTAKDAETTGIDAKPDADGGKPNSETDGGADVADVEDPGDAGFVCTEDAQCEGKVPTDACHAAKCDAGKCKAEFITGSCCVNENCDDGNVCTADTCDLQKHTCQTTPDPTCCPGQIKLLSGGFEQGDLEGFKSTDGPTSGNVKWQLDSTEAHSGSTSLYFGNECYAYDTSKTQDNGCKADPAKSKAVSTLLQTPEVSLPAGNQQSVLDFWIKIDAEPMLDEGVTPKPTCSPKCLDGSTCVDVGAGTALCAPENDLLKVSVLVDGKTVPVWNSFVIGKSTNGWLHLVTNLASFTGKTIKVQWAFNTNDGVGNDYKGIFLDDVSVKTLCKNDCSPSKPCDADTNACTSNACSFFTNDSSGGVCYFDLQPDCCESDADCNDSKICTLDSCAIVDTTTGKKACIHAPNGANKNCCDASQKPALSDDIEGGIGSWSQVGGSSATAKWQIDPSKAGGGAQSLYFGDLTTMTYVDKQLGDQPVKGTICTPESTLGSGDVYDVLTFKLLLSTEWDAIAPENYKNPPVVGDLKLPKIDWLQVSIKTGGLMTEVWTSDIIFGSTHGKWIDVKADVTKFKGKAVAACFTFDTGDGVNNAFEGPHIDDVTLKVTCSAEKCGPSDVACIAQCGTCGVPGCDAQGACTCAPVAECCTKDGDCDDKDDCTDDACDVTAKTCKHTYKDVENCCTPKDVVDQDFETGDLKQLTGWKASTLTGKSQGGQPYDPTVVWNISNLKAKDGTFSLYFGKDGTYNTGTTTPAGKVTSPKITLPPNGYVVANFDLFLGTEWDGQTFKDPSPLVIDKLVVNVIDAADPTKPVTLWHSYEITGSTNGKWLPITIDLSAYKGKEVQVQFYFDAGSSVNNAKEGVYIDNFKVKGLCAKPECLGGKDCDDTNPCTLDACNAQGICTHAFASGVPGCCQSSVGLAPDGFEGSSFASNWNALNQNSTTVIWQAVETDKLTGTKAAYFGNATNKNYADATLAVGTGPQGELVSKAITLNQAVDKKAVLSFSVWLDIEPNVPETFEVRVHDSTGTVKLATIWKNDVLQSTDYKVKKSVTVDVSAYKGQTISIGFFFDSGDDIDNDMFEGVYLDDVKIDEVCL